MQDSTHITELEAECKRLRDLLRETVAYVRAYPYLENVRPLIARVEAAIDKKPPV